MEQSASDVVSHRKRYLGLGVVLIIAGLAIAALTFITIFGPIFGLLLAAAGVIVLARSGKSERPPPD